MQTGGYGVLNFSGETRPGKEGGRGWKGAVLAIAGLCGWGMWGRRSHQGRENVAKAIQAPAQPGLSGSLALRGRGEGTVVSALRSRSEEA